MDFLLMVLRSDAPSMSRLACRSLAQTACFVVMQRVELSRVIASVKVPGARVPSDVNVHFEAIIMNGLY